MFERSTISVPFTYNNDDADDDDDNNNNNNNNNNNADRNVVEKEAEKKLKYKSLCIEIQRM